MEISIHKYISFTTLAFCILLNAFTGFSQQVFPIITSEEGIEVEKTYIQVLEDRNNQITPSYFIDSLKLKEFSPVNNKVPKPKTTYWLLFRLENLTDRDGKWLIDAGRYYVKELYSLDSLKAGFINPKRNGRLIPYNEKAIQGFANYANPLELFLPKGKPRTFLLKVHSPTDFYLPNRFLLYLDSPSRFRTTRYFSNVIGAFLVGGITLISLYHICLFFFLKERMYLYFVGLTFTTALFYAYFHGFSIEFLWPNAPFWDIYSFIFILSIYAFCLLSFAKLYISVDDLLGIWRNLLNGLRMASLLPAVIVLHDFITEVPHSTILPITTKLQTVLMLIIEIFLLLLSGYGSLKRVSGARFFFFANMPPLVGGVCLSLVFLNVLPSHEIFSLAPQVGILMMAIMFSYGLGKKIIRMRDEIGAKQRRAERLEREKEIEKQKIIEQKNQELEQKVKERTSQIVQQKEEITMQKQSIELQNTQLQSLNEEKNNLINVVAHDLKSPLNQINGLMYILKSSIKDLSGEQASIINMVSDSSTRLTSMITNLLDINAIESGKVNIEKKATNMSELGQKVIEQFQELAQKKKIKIYADLPPNLYVQADSSLLYQCFENLLSNAIKFSKPEKSVYVKLEEKEQNVRLLVQDEGPGLSTEDMEKLFGKFQRLSAQPTGGEHSTGLGLSIVKRYVEAMGGHVWCESELGEGATFIVELPAIE